MAPWCAIDAGREGQDPVTVFTIRVHHRLDVLADLWVQLRQAPADPLGVEPVLIQSRSLAGWLETRCAAATGIAAGIEWLTPRRLLARLGGASVREDDDPWAREQLRWRLDALLATYAEDPRFAAPAEWLSAGGPRARLQLLNRLADVMDTYQLARPALLAAWEAGREPLGHRHEPWQAALWRDLRAQESRPHAGEHFERLRAEIAAGRPPQHLPPQLDAIGISGLTRPLTHLLADLGRFADVTLWIVQPTPHAWDHLRARSDAQDGHPLLADLGLQGRAWFRLLAEVDHDGQAWMELPIVPPPPPDTVLHALHHDISAIALPPEPRALHDASLQLLRCPTPLREVEAARDAILAAFRDLPELRPEDISLLTPDLPTYAPLIDTVLARPIPGHPHGLPMTLVDRPLARGDAVAQAFLAILAVVGGRLPRSDVLALLGHDAIALAAQADALARERIADLMDRAGVRFGVDAPHRARLGLPPSPDGTWRQGLDRLIAGWLSGSEAPVATTAGPLWPAGGAGGLPAVAPVVAWIERLLTCAAEASDDAPRHVWAERLRRWLALLLDHRQLDRTATAAAIERLALAPDARPWPLAALVDALTDDLDDSAKGPAWRGTRLAVGGLKPLAALPRKVVVLVGMGDQFPRRARPVAFDLIAAHPEPGDRAPREDDRQLFLDAVLAAQERLIITWTGMDPRTGSDQPASVCVDALRATLARSVANADALLTTIPVQPPGLVRPPAIPTPFATTLPPAHEDELHLATVIARLTHPAKAWLTALGVHLPSSEDADTAHDDDAWSLDALATTTLGSRTVDLLRDGQELDLGRLRADGALPPGGLGQATWDDLVAEARHVAKIAGPRPPGPDRHGVLIGPDGERLAVRFSAPGPTGLTLCRFAKAKPKDRLTLWLTHLAWSAWCEAHGDGPARTRGVWQDQQRILAPVRNPWQHLGPVLAAARHAVEVPLPFWPATAERLIAKHAKAEPDFTPPELHQDDQRDRWTALAWRDHDIPWDAAQDLADTLWAPLTLAEDA